MRTLTGELAQANAERSLFLTYAASPLLFETLLLPSLQHHGAAEVTLLVDGRAFVSSLAEAAWTRGAGVSYRYHPVHLPKRFHPKLYLTLNSRAASLLVASANLTPSSLHENAEVLDRLVLPWDGEGDAAAFLDFADLLETLLDSGWVPRDAESPIRRLRDDLSTHALGATRSSPARLLHSGAQALLPQVVDHLRDHCVEELVVVSPFFDRGSRALLSLASAFPAAAIRLVTRLDPTNLDPRVLAPLRDRLQIRSYGDEGDRRRLHAKALWLRAGNRAWALMGSANLTWPAWMASAKAGGNFEAMVLRPDDSGEILEALFSPPSEPLPLDRLQHRPEPEEEEPYRSGLQIRSASLSGGWLVVHAKADARWAEAVAEVEIELQGEAHAPVATVRWSEGGFELRAPFVLPLGGMEVPVLIRVSLARASGERITGYAWLHRPDALDRSARERRWRRAVAIVDQNGWGYGCEEYAAVVDLWCELVRTASTSAIREDIQTVGRSTSAGAEHPLETRDARSGARLVMPIGDLPSRVHREGSAAHGLLARLAHTLGRLLGDYDFERTIEARTWGDAADAEEDTGDELAAVEWHASAAERRLAETADRELFSAIPTLFAAPIDPAQVPGIALGLEVLLRLLLQRFARISTTSGENTQPVIRQLREALRLSLSLDGIVRGTPEGWFLRGWSDESWRRIVREQFDYGERIATILASIGFVAAEEPEGREMRTVADIVAGLEVICLRNPAEIPAVAENLLTQLQNVTSRGRGLPNAARVAELVGKVARANLPFLGLLSALEPVLHAEDGQEVPDDRLPEQYRKLRGRGKRGAARLLVGPGGLGCSGCGMRLPLAEAAAVERSLRVCVYCQRVLLPCDLQNTTVTAVLADLRVSRGEVPNG